MKESILCSAIWFDDNKSHPEQPVKTGFVTCGLRHSNCLSTALIINMRLVNTPQVYGFLTNKNRFVGRSEAAIIAYTSGQIKESILELNSDEIF